MNESKYLRELIIHGGVDSTHAEDRRNLIRQISGIATNINQMAKVANTHGDLPSETKLRELATKAMTIGKEVGNTCQSLNRSTHGLTAKQP